MLRVLILSSVLIPRVMGLEHGSLSCAESREPIDTVFYRPSQPLSIKLTIEGLGEVFLHVGRMGKETLESEHYKTINVTNLTLY